MEIKSYNALPPQARLIREEVFVKEQGFREEFDSIDKISTHIVITDGDKPVAVGRFYCKNNPRGEKEYFIGRLAVMREYRGRGIGASVIKEAERLIKEQDGSCVLLHSQCRAAEFYEKQGYKKFGEIDYDEDCPHIWMRKFL